MKYGMYEWGKLDSDTLKYVVEPEGGPDTPRDNNAQMKYATAIFPVRSRDEQGEQLQRARDFRDYLNMQEEAKEEALKKITITTAVAKRMSGQ
jgi:hypothetical protein